jgi:hypothetical protein
LIYPRFARRRLDKAPSDTPVNLLRGPRHCGKSTLTGVTGELAGIEVKAAATVTATDFRGLKKLREATGNRFLTGVVLDDGTMERSLQGLATNCTRFLSVRCGRLHEDRISPAQARLFIPS